MNDELDDALDRLRGTGTEVAGGGDPNHGPMVVEALVAMGRADAAPRWAERYRQRLATRPPATSPVLEGTWREALGHEQRLADWVAFFERHLAERPWQSVVSEWLERLVPAILTAGRHGLIRTAHVVRALSAKVTPLRIEELAVALAYWASHYRELGAMPRFRGELDLPAALERIPRLMRGQARPGMPRTFLYTVQGEPRLVAGIEALSARDSVAETVGQLAELGARLYLANRSRFPLIFVHSVTAVAAFRLLLPFMTPDTQRAALAYYWQSEAATVAAYGEDSDDVGAALQAELPAWSEMVERAVERGDAHSIKFIEASMREYRLRPSETFRAAAVDWTNRLGAAASWSNERRRAAGIIMG